MPTKIPWCDETLQPAYGCTWVSPACDNCYAIPTSVRQRCINDIGATRHEGLVKNDKWTGRVNLNPDWAKKAMRWKRPRRIFLGSMTDLFHEAVPDSYLHEVFQSVHEAEQHTFIVLTKRPERMRDYMQEWDTHVKERIMEPLPNLWLGVTAENQEQADKRIPILLDTPAAKRFVSIEPMLGPIDLQWKLWQWMRTSDIPADALDDGCTRGIELRTPGLDWVIVGGESGPKARPMHPDWARSIRDQCQAAGVPFFFKQWGEWQDGSHCNYKNAIVMNDGRYFTAPEMAKKCPEYQDRDDRTWTKKIPTRMACVGKKQAGDLLDGVQHQEFPEVKK